MEIKTKPKTKSQICGITFHFYLHSLRPVFNWAHLVVGNLAHIFAISAIFLGLNMHRLRLPAGLTYGLIVYVILYILVHVLFILQTYFNLNYPSEINDNQV